jgi:hypothetical protein
MIGTLILVAGVATFVGAGSATLGFAEGRRRGARQAEGETASKVTVMASQRDSAERRAREAQSESARWKGTSLAGEALSSSAVFVDRPAPRDAEELARLVHGLTFVDDVVLADRSGHPLTRETERASADLASLAPHVLQFSRRLSLAALPVLDVAFETSGAVHVHARPLAGRGEGALLLVKTTSRPVNSLVVDAVMHAAVRELDELPAGVPASLSLTGSNDRSELSNAPFTEAFAVLERALGEHFTAIVLAVDGRPVFSAAKDGPAANGRDSVTTALTTLATQVTRGLRTTSMGRVAATLRGGHTVSWSAVTPGSRLSLITFGRTDERSAARLDRLLGTLRRGIEQASSGDLLRGSAA